VLVTQLSLFDGTRAPAGKHIGWAYCHVPNGSTVDMTEAIEAQVERFAPGFRERILARHVMPPAELERGNPNLVGGDFNGGAMDGLQMFLRPTARLYRTPLDGVFFCSSSTPPGGGVHGMCGYNAAKVALG
jgi:phytoene dehydrogenase-like protein